jgi:hypothetical protein
MVTIAHDRFDDDEEHVNESSNLHAPPQRHSYVWSPH